jgi:hypothetical protein
MATPRLLSYVITALPKRKGNGRLERQVFRIYALLGITVLLVFSDLPSRQRTLVAAIDWSI